MDFFTLEALPARYGDCLLLHYGSAAKPGLILIDGGPAKVWPTLNKRLSALRAARGAGFAIDLLMVSHIDDDHVVGLDDMTRAWRDAVANGEAWLFPVKQAWFNSFERISNATTLDAVTASVLASTNAAAVRDVDLEKAGIEDGPEQRAALHVLASVGNANKLRNDLKALNVPRNTGFAGLVKPGDGPSVPAKFGPKLTLRVAGPLSAQLEKLQKMFAKELPKGPEASLAAYVDASVPNLSSIVALAAFGGKEILLTGDARGDYVLEGLKAEGLLNAQGKRHVQILKMPHHGSDRNVEAGFFEALTADHYVASADGTFGNPDRACLEMLIGARAKTDKYVIHLTYPLAEIDARRKAEWDRDRQGEIDKGKTPRPAWDHARDDLAALFAKAKAAGHKFKVAAPAAGTDAGARINLLGALPF